MKLMWDFVITHPESGDMSLTRSLCVEHMWEYDQMKALKELTLFMPRTGACPGVTNPADYGKILSKDMSWTVDAAHMAATNNAFFMHCLPVRRNMIVTDDVIVLFIGDSKLLTVKSQQQLY